MPPTEPTGIGPFHIRPVWRTIGPSHKDNLTTSAYLSLTMPG
jgi:hypothetical protein